MRKSISKAIVSTALVAAMVVTSVPVAAAASPTKGVEPEALTMVKGEDTGKGISVWANTSEDGSAVIKKVKSKKKTITFNTTVKINGINYTYIAVGKKAFKKCKKLKKVTLPISINRLRKQSFMGSKVKDITLTSKYAPTVAKSAFKGLRTKKMTIRATAMDAKQVKKLKKALKTAKFKGSVVTA